MFISYCCLPLISYPCLEESNLQIDQCSIILSLSEGHRRKISLFLWQNLPQSLIWGDFPLRNLLLLSYSLWHERISNHLKLSIFMLKRHFKDKLFLLLCHWDVPLAIQQKCSFHFHKHDKNTILSEICILQVLLINLHFKECEGFIWKKKEESWR